MSDSAIVSGCELAAFDDLYQFLIGNVRPVLTDMLAVQVYQFLIGNVRREPRNHGLYRS